MWFLGGSVDPLPPQTDHQDHLLQINAIPSVGVLQTRLLLMQSSSCLSPPHASTSAGSRHRQQMDRLINWFCLRDKIKWTKPISVSRSDARSWNRLVLSRKRFVAQRWLEDCWAAVFGEVGSLVLRGQCRFGSLVLRGQCCHVRPTMIRLTQPLGSYLILATVVTLLPTFSVWYLRGRSHPQLHSVRGIHFDVCCEP